MRKQQRLVETRFAATDLRIDRDARQRLELRQHVRVEGQRHQRGARRDHGHAELLGDAITETARAYFRNRRPTRRDHQRRASIHAGIGGDLEAAVCFSDV